MRITKLIVLIFIVLSSTLLNAEDRDVNLNRLFKELKSNNVKSAYEAEKKIWKIWSTHPTDQQLTDRLAEGSKLVRDNQLFEAVEIFTEVINIDPIWAEAWNKRATVLYLMSDYNGSQNDIDEVLRLEERHFGALAGQGLVNIKLKKYEKALMSYEKAQKFYPSMKSVKGMIKKIEKQIRRQST